MNKIVKEQLKKKILLILLTKEEIWNAIVTSVKIWLFILINTTDIQ